jgi:tetratricopeptide (TPR) repeat protein
VHSLENYGAALRIENALITPWIYIGKTLWPAGLSPIYSWPTGFPLWETLAAGASLAAVSALAIGARRTRPWLAVGWFWFLITLAPVIGLVQVGEQARADRYMYVPMVGLGLAAAFGVDEFVRTRPGTRKFAAAAAFAVLALCAWIARVQVGYWRDSEGLFRHAIADDAGNYSAWYYLGQTLSAERAGTDALAAFETAVSLRPGFVQARDRLGRELLDEGRTDEAIAQYNAALRIDPAYARAHADFGLALVRANRMDQAISQFRAAAELAPDYLEARINLGVALGNSPGMLPEAAAELEKAVALDPSSALAQFNLGVVLGKMPGRQEESLDHLEEAVRIEPGYPAAHRELGRALLKTPITIPEGIAHLETAERLEPDPAVQAELNSLKGSH